LEKNPVRFVEKSDMKCGLEENPVYLEKNPVFLEENQESIASFSCHRNLLQKLLRDLNHLQQLQRSPQTGKKICRTKLRCCNYKPRQQKQRKKRQNWL
jgi:hypothetical protein